MSENTERLAAEIVFHPMTETPTRPGDCWQESALIFNQCDGYHLVYAHFEEDGEFRGFFDFMGTSPYEPDKHYCAWALLPGSMKLHGVFARPGPYQGD